MTASAVGKIGVPVVVQMYRRRPQYVRAVQWSGDNWQAVVEVCKGHGYCELVGSVLWAFDLLEGMVQVESGEWLAMADDGLHRISHKSFNQMYELVG